MVLRNNITNGLVNIDRYHRVRIALMKHYVLYETDVQTTIGLQNIFKYKYLGCINVYLQMIYK